MKDSDIKINYKVLAFKVPKSQAHEYGGVIDLLGQIGYPVRDIFLETKLKFEVGLIKTTIIKDGAKDWYVESLLSLLNSIVAEGEWNWDSRQVNISESFEEAYQIVRKIAIDLPFQIDENDVVFMALCAHQAEDSSNLFKFLKTSAEEQLIPFKFIWGSHQNK